jgi:sodium transport system ATP-binding protein
VPAAQARERTDALLQALALRELADRRVEGFSHGERLKVALARALIHDPRNVLLDEPTAGLDVMSIRSLRDFLRQLREHGRCVLFSTHVMQEVSALCDRIVIIAHGRVIAEGTPQAMRERAHEQNLEEAFVKLIGAAALA